MRKVTEAGLLLCAMSLASIPAAWAQTGKYPDRPIRLISPFPPGGTVDVTARILAPAVTKSIGQQVVVDNRSGASGIIGTAEAARAKPDGYTLLINTTPMVTNPLMYNKVPYNVLQDFEAISILASTHSFLSVHPSVPVKTVGELIKLAKARPGEVSIAYSGVAGAVGFVQSGRLRADGLDVIGSTPEQAAATLESDIKKYAVLIRERGMKAE